MGDGIEYVPLVQQPHDDPDSYHDDPDFDSNSLPHRAHPHLSVQHSFKTIGLLAFFAVLVSSLSFAASAYHLLTAPPYVLPAHDVDVRTLHRPSLYAGLERVPTILKHLAAHDSDAHPMPNLTSPPVVELPVAPGRATAMARINARDPGTAHPQDGWVLLTAHVRPTLLSVLGTCPELTLALDAG